MSPDTPKYMISVAAELVGMHPGQLAARLNSSTSRLA